MSEVVVAPPVRHPTPSRAATRELWLDRLARFPSSGLTVAQFCAIEAVSLSSFYFWKRRLAVEAQAATTQDPSGDRGPRLLPVRLQPTAPAVELVLTTGAVLRLPPGCDLSWVRSRLLADSLSGHLFIFRNRTADRLKVLYWGGHGLCLWCQRLEAGRYHFPTPPTDSASMELSAGQFQMILDGIDLTRVKRFKRFTPP